MAAAGNKKAVMDVSKPGKTAADATSRPVIITHGAMVKDPMVNEEAATDIPEQEVSAPAPSAPKKVITPPSEEAPKAEDASDESKPEEATQKPVEQKEPEPTPTEADTQSQDEGAVVDAVVDQVADKKVADEVAAEDEKRTELVTKLVTEKKYFVPLAVARHNRNSKLGIIFITILILVAIGVVLAIDAEIIGQDIQLPFDLIKR